MYQLVYSNYKYEYDHKSITINKIKENPNLQLWKTERSICLKCGERERERGGEVESFRRKWRR